MEIREIISYSLDDTLEKLDVKFKLISDDDDEIRKDKINFDEIKNFGYEFLLENFDDFEDEEIEDFLFEEFEEDLNKEDIRAFLQEYYLIFPDKLPKPKII